MKKSILCFLMLMLSSIVNAKCHHYCQVQNGGSCRCDGELGKIVNFKSKFSSCEYICYLNKHHFCQRQCPPE